MPPTPSPRQAASTATANANNGLSRRAAMAEVGRSGLSHSRGVLLSEFDHTLRGERGARFYREMATNDPTIGAVMNAVEMTLRGIGWHANPIDDSAPAQAQAEFVDSCRDDMSHSWADFLSEALTMLVYGFAPIEHVFKLRQGDGGEIPSRFDDGKIGWRKLALRGQDTITRWNLDDAGGILGFWQRGADFGAEIPIPIEKVVLFRTRRERNNPEGRSLLRNAARAYTMKKGLEEIVVVGAERDLTGLPIVYLPADATSADFSTAQQVVERVHIDDQAGLVLQRFGPSPENNWEFQLVSSPGQKAVDTEAAINRCAAEISLVFLAQFLRLGMSNVGSLALAKTQSALFNSALSAILDNLQETINRFMLAPLLRLNGQPVLCELAHDPIPQDLDAMANFISKLAPAGFLTANAKTEQALRGLADLPKLTDDEMAAMDERRQATDQAKADMAQVALENAKNPPPVVVPGQGGQPRQPPTPAKPPPPKGA